MSQTLDSRWLICRICLKKEHKKLYHIFEPITEVEIADLGTTLMDKIELFGNIKLYQQSNLPNRICNRCVLLLRAAFKFRELCQQSHNQLKQFLNNLPQKQDDDYVDEKICTAINFMSDNDEQKVESKVEDSIIVTGVDDYVVDVVEENVVEYDSSEERSETKNKAEQYIPTIDDEETEFPGFSDEDDRQYLVEEVDEKEFVSEDNEVMTTTYTFEENIHSDNITLEEQTRETIKQIYFKSYNEKIPTVRRKPKNSLGQGFNGIYKCTFCDNTYTDKTKFNNHLKIHAKDKPHECEICKKRFSTTPQLSRHMNSHTGNRPYKCLYCEARFGDPSTKIKHERIHTNERPFKCNLCNKAFAYSNVLKVHMMTHTGEKPYSCGYCLKSFTQLHHKKAHEKRHRVANMNALNSSSPDIEYMEEEEEELRVQN